MLTAIRERIESKVLVTMMLSHYLNKIRTIIQRNGAPFTDELSRMEEDFQRMSDFFAMGNIDPDLDKVYYNLEARAKKLLQQVETYGLTVENAFYRKMVSDTKGSYTLDLEELQHRLEDFVIDLTMLDLEADGAAKTEKRRQIHASHHEYRKVMFAQIFLASFVDKENADSLQEIILSSSIDNIDAQLMVTALMLSSFKLYEENKLSILHNIYKLSENEELREKALVSYILSVALSPRSANVGNAVSPALLAQIQQQILYTIDTPRVEKIMQNDIMPDIIKNSDFDFRNNRIIPKQKDKLDDILNPHKDEEMIERMEETMNRMKKLQEQGSDLFFGGFRYVKTHPFFSDIINWFCPFYFDHPQLPTFTNEDDRRITSKLITRTPFCDSDKYSFIISMHKAIATIPAEMKNMLKNGEAQLDIVGAEGVEHNAAFIRRTYLQDIFRFFKICSWATHLPNPISTENSLVVRNFIAADNHNYDQAAISSIKALRKFEASKQMEDLLGNWNPTTAEGKIFKAFNTLDSDHTTSMQLFAEILAEDAHNIQALYGLAKACFHDFKSQSFWQPYQEDAIKSLLALYFKNENDINVQHTLVKAYLLAGDHDKALRYSRQLMESGKAESFVLTFIGITTFAQGDIRQALSLFRQSGESISRIIQSAADYNMPFSIPQQDLLAKVI